MWVVEVCRWVGWKEGEGRERRWVGVGGGGRREEKVDGGGRKERGGRRRWVGVGGELVSVPWLLVTPLMDADGVSSSVSSGGVCRLHVCENKALVRTCGVAQEG